MNTAEIALSDIDVGERLRVVDPDYAAMLAESIRLVGQMQPIEVRPAGARYALIAGAHRIAAARIVGLETIRAVVVQADDLQARIREIDENLFRRELSELDRATFLAERQAIYRELHPETAPGGNRDQSATSDQTDKIVHLVPTFAEATAERLGISDRSVRRYIQRYRMLLPDVRERIATTWIADKGSELDALARLDAGMQRAVVKAMLRAEDPARSVAAALEAAGSGGRSAGKSEAELQFAALRRAWGKAGRAARRRFVDLLVAEGAVERGA